jgi:predicted nucleic acid-binding protein
VAALKQIHDPLATVWPALTEALQLVRRSQTAVDALFDMIDDEALVLLPLDAADALRMKELMRKYRDLPMDVADAALVRVAERERLSRILTFDRHFKVYALPRRTRFTLLPR